MRRGTCREEDGGWVVWLFNDAGDREAMVRKLVTVMRRGR
jgi:hypothetical protein